MGPLFELIILRSSLKRKEVVLLSTLVKIANHFKKTYGEKVDKINKMTTSVIIEQIKSATKRIKGKF